MEKKLQRDKGHSVIGGVCAGLANYLDLDPTLVRLLFAFMVLFAGTGILLYVILWIVMPAGYPLPAADTVEGVVVDTGESPNASKGSLVFGLVLIGIGALGLLHRFVPEFNWQVIWPVFLIVLGIVLIIPKTKKS